MAAGLPYGVADEIVVGDPTVVPATQGRTKESTNVSSGRGLVTGKGLSLFSF